MYKPTIIFLLILLIQACSSSSKNNLIINTTEFSKTSKTQDSKNQELLVIQDNNLSEKNYNNDKANDDVCITSNINTRLPIFLLTGPVNSFTSIYGQYLCDLLNNDVTNNKYVAVTQPLYKPQEAINYLRKDDLTINSKVPFIADFLITRVDYLFDKVRNNSGPLKDQPTLDIVMFLNGNYLFLWGDNKYGAIEFSDFVKKFHINKPEQNLVIAVANNFAKELLTKVILANTWDTKIDFVSLEDVNNLKNDKLKNYELVAYAGPVINDEVVKTLQNYDKQFVPLTIAEDIILNTQKTNPEISSSDITDYYARDDLIGISLLTDNSNTQVTNSDNVLDNGNPQEEHTCKNENSEIPFVNTKKYCQNYDEYVFGKSKFNFNIQPVEKILEVKGKLININNIKVYSIGIRNVLVATRNTDVCKVFDLASAFFAQYNYIKSNYITSDMKNFTIKDLITGNLYKNDLKYHYGILNYKTYAKDNNHKVMSNEADIPLIISSNLTSINYPDFFGPEPPISKEVNIINTIYKKNLIYRRQEEVLKGLQFIVDSLKMELFTNISKKEPVDIGTNSISQKDNEELYPDLNITDNNFNTGLINCLPFSNLTLGK